MNARADNINGLVEHQMMLRCSPKLAERVRADFVNSSEDSRPPFSIKWLDEHHAQVTFGIHTYPGVLLNLPTVNETYKMATKSRLFKSGDVGQMLVVYDPNDEEEKEFFDRQRFDANSWTLLSGITPPSTYIWSRIFRKANKAPKVDFAKIEQELGDVNIIGKEDVDTEFIHPKELDLLFLKPGQALMVDGKSVEPVEGKSVGEIIKIRRKEEVEKLQQKLAEEKRQRKEAKRRKKLEQQGLLSPSASSSQLPVEPLQKKSRPDESESSSQPVAANTNAPGGSGPMLSPPVAAPQASWMIAADKAMQRQELEKKLQGLKGKLLQMEHRPDTQPQDIQALKAEIEATEKEIATTLV